MGFSNRVAWEILRSVDSATLTGIYVPLGTPLAHPSIIFKMVNNSSSLILVSVDGVNAYDVLPANSFFLYDENPTSNQSLNALPEGTQIYISGTAGVGLVYLATQYIFTTPG